MNSFDKAAWEVVSL